MILVLSESIKQANLACLEQAACVHTDSPSREGYNHSRFPPPLESGTESLHQRQLQTTEESVENRRARRPSNECMETSTTFPKKFKNCNNPNAFQRGNHPLLSLKVLRTAKLRDPLAPSAPFALLTKPNANPTGPSLDSVHQSLTHQQSTRPAQSASIQSLGPSAVDNFSQKLKLRPDLG